ncbi:hypothetical protein CKM354_001001800 [Cercospora kikuchii]|uniref:Uncharacterized protein n=1 Tax=Cercospora kikuchii TaxID=84275 RepID=A0A9P3CSS6_9PEZI|nr:uncharacterized protein CKM354_001001800 [Cercospora kikuchii]GIZ46912.1 hypothetical protein CKM354_001001800 [Cercospora kikuchii]
MQDGSESEQIGFTLQRLDLSSDLTASRRESIDNALRHFRRTVLDQNLLALRILVEAAQQEVQALSPGLSNEQIEEALEYHFECEYQITYSTAKSLLEGSADDMIAVFCLEGVDHDPVDLSARDHWWASLWNVMKSSQQHIEPFPTGLPQDMKYLTTLVSGITGGGLPYWREMQHPDFFKKVDVRLLESPVDHRKRICIPSLGNWQDVAAFQSKDVLDPNNAVGYTWAIEDWDISVASNMSSWPEKFSDGTFVLYCCRQQETEDSHLVKTWDWRYGFQRGIFSSELFESVEEYLAWYAHWDEQTEGNTESVLFSLW